MAPTRVFSSSASPAYLRRFSLVLLSSTLVLLLAGTALASMATDSPLAPDPSADAGGVSWDAGVVPDVALLVTGLDPGDRSVDERLVPSLLTVPGVESVESMTAGVDQIAVIAAIDETADGDQALSAIEAVVANELPDARVSVGGRAVADRDLLDRLNRGTIVAVVPVLILLTVLLIASFGSRVGSAAGATVAAATLLSGLIGHQAAGSFDGSLGTTALPGVLVAALISTVMSLRLLDWFKHPMGVDAAESIRRSVRHLLPEAGLLVGGITITTGVLALSGPGRNQALVVGVGAFFGTVVTFAVLPSLLATLPPVVDEDDYRLFRLNLPDGRDFPTAVFAGFAIFLVILGLFALRVPSAALLDTDSLPGGSAAARVATELETLGGDPTSGILAEFDSRTPAAAIDTWARQASAMVTVGAVNTAEGRYEDGELVAVAADPARFERDDSPLALVAPLVAARSVAAQELVELLEQPQMLPYAPELSGTPVAALSAGREGIGNLWMLVVALAATGGVTVLLLVGDIKLAALSAGLRIVGSAALLGVYRIVADTASGSELQTAALVVGVGVGLFELGFLRRLAAGSGLVRFGWLGADSRVSGSSRGIEEDTVRGFVSPAEASDPVTDALRHEGRAAMLGLGVTALCGLGFLASDLEVVRRLGVALAAGIIVELLVATWLLRPVLLGRRLLLLAGIGSDRRVSVAAPGRRRVSVAAVDPELRLPSPALDDHGPVDRLPPGLVAPRTLAEATGVAAPESPAALAVASADDVAWRRIVAGLLRSEFAFQTDPGRAELGTVFVENTPVHGELAEHNRRLRSAGFRVAGEGPRLVSVRAVNSGSPAIVAITVDHPERRLLDRDGRVLGVRKSELRDGMLWLIQDPSGRYRIAEAVDLGAAVPSPVPEPATASGPLAGIEVATN